jgi:hypothetical protein
MKSCMSDTPRGDQPCSSSSPLIYVFDVLSLHRSPALFDGIGLTVTEKVPLVDRTTRDELKSDEKSEA